MFHHGLIGRQRISHFICFHFLEGKSTSSGRFFDDDFYVNCLIDPGRSHRIYDIDIILFEEVPNDCDKLQRWAVLFEVEDKISNAQLHVCTCSLHVHACVHRYIMFTYMYSRQHTASL